MPSFLRGHNACHNGCKTVRDPISPPSPTSYQPSRSWIKRFLFRVLAILSLGLGIAGVFIPGLPTTVFILIAGWAAARSSPTLHAWLWNHKVFGPMLVNWSQGGYVSRKAKYSAVGMMLLCAAIMWFSPTPMWGKLFASVCMLGVGIWLCMRPEP